MKPTHLAGTLVKSCMMIKQDYQKALADLKYYDCEHNDLIHAVELIPYNASQRLNMFKQIKVNRLNRREAKDTLEKLEPLYKLLQNNASFFSQLKDANGEVMKITMEQKNRSYKVRVRKDMQEDFNKLKKGLM